MRLIPLLPRPVLAVALLFCAAAFAPTPAHALDPADLPPVDEVFVPEVEAVAPDRVEVRWKIADGYYLYRHRIGVQPTSPGVTAGALRLPRGEPHEDEFFGKTETYRRRLVATLPDIAGAGATLTLKIKYQGCADAGICYPPQTRTLDVAMPSAGMPGATGATGATAISGGDAFSLGERGAGFSLGGPKLALPEERAFGFEAIVIDGNAVMLRFAPAEGYYLYRDRTTIEVRGEGEAVVQGKPAWPAATAWRDEHFGQVQVYFTTADVRVPLMRASARALPVSIVVDFQGCQTDGICYPPMRRTARLTLPAGARVVPATTMTAAAQAAAEAAAARAAAMTAAGKTPADAASQAVASDVDASRSGTDTAAPAGLSADGAASTVVATGGSGTAGSPAPAARGAVTSVWTALLFALLGGLILNLMPCVLPVLSIKLLGLVENNTGGARMRRHALWYTVGVLASFIALGAAILALRGVGENLGLGFQLQRPGIVAVLGLVMFAFGLSLSGVWHVGGRWVGAGQSLTERDGALGDVFTGVLAVVVAAPCTAPFMAVALSWALTAGNAFETLAVFAGLGVGLASPVLLIGFVPALARLLPKPGAWMETFKQLLAFPLYASAIWLVWVLAKQRGADAVGWWAAAALLVAFAAWAWTHARMRGTRMGLVAAVLALLAVPWLVLTIARLPVAATTRVPAAMSAPSMATRTVPYSAQRLAELRREGRVVLVNMTADWCITCKVNEKAVFSREEFREALVAADAVYMVGDWTDVDPAITEYLKRYGSVGVPLYVIYPRGGGEGQALPTLLTPTIVGDALRAAAAGRAAP